MKKILGTLGFALLALGNQCDLSAQDTKWREIFFEDFGGNNANDEKYGDKLPSDLVGSSLSYSRLPYGEKYCIVKSSDDNGSNWHPGSDHTHLDDNTRGYYMRLDPPNTAGNVAVYRQKLTGICEGVNFKFSSWFAILSPREEDPKPNIAVGIFEDADAKNLVSSNAYIRRELVETPLSGAASLNWQPLSLEFKVGEGIEEAYFIVTVYAPESNGCDFAIDDIKIEVEQPAITIEHTPYIMDEPATLTASFVNNGFFSDLSVVKYKWQFSADGVNFSDIAGSENYYKNDNNCSLNIPSFSKEENNGHYRVIIGEASTLNKPICSIQEDFVINETKNKVNVVLCKNEIKEVMGVTLNASRLHTGQELSAGTDFTLVITIIEPKEIVLPDTFLCVGSTVNGTVYNSPTEFEVVETISSKVSDCDSITYIKKYVITSATVRDLGNVDICQNETYKTKKYTEAGSFTEIQDEGCIQYKELVVVHPSHDLERTYSICQGYDFGGTTYHEAGSFEKVLSYKTTTWGCDSIIHATINVTEKIEVDLEDVELCEGTDAYTFDGKVYSAAGTYNLTGKSTSVISGCDSITNVRVIIHPRYSNRSNPIDTMICYDSKMFGTVYSEPTTAPILVRDPTDYKTIHGCDSVVYYNLEVLKIQLKLEIKSDKNTVCKGEEVEIFIKDLKPANTPLTWTPDLGGASPNRKTFSPSEDMVCVVKARNDIAQCETTDTARIYVKESPIIAIDTLDEKNNIVTYSVTSGTAPLHVYLDKNQISMEANGEIKNSAIGVHKVWVKDSSDCTSTATYEIKPVPITPMAYVTPNNDGINDTWTIENIDVYPLSRVRIFNRDGKMLLEYQPYDNANGFDGTYMGKALPSTDYWYEIDLVESDQQYIGHFTLLR